VRRLLTGNAAGARAEILSRIRDEAGAATWPMAEPTRTLGQLRELANDLRDQGVYRERLAREAARRKRLAAIAADLNKLIANVEKLVQTRSVDNYEQAARELVDLREALGPERGPVEARAVAEKLRRGNPRLHRLIGALRKHGLLD
jgi:uncharacterized Zn finger protein